jgi:hypothetical protein
LSAGASGWAAESLTKCRARTFARDPRNAGQAQETDCSQARWGFSCGLFDVVFLLELICVIFGLHLAHDRLFYVGFFASPWWLANAGRLISERYCDAILLILFLIF